jgi:hypothetical protein
VARSECSDMNFVDASSEPKYLSKRHCGEKSPGCAVRMVKQEDFGGVEGAKRGNICKVTLRRDAMRSEFGSGRGKLGVCLGHSNKGEREKGRKNKTQKSKVELRRSRTSIHNPKER